VAAYVLTISYWKVQASIAKGHSEDAVSSYKKTLPNATVAEEQLNATLESSEGSFTLWTVEQLTQSLE
jgi:4'-phosphopantetheinyl transferase